ncbi:MAG: amidohydrolase family protein [Burkholderiales bacterium]|nr:amidohydrolase family protein [Burkholderiales bacterium]
MKTLVRNACVICVNSAGDVFEDGFIVLNGPRIADVGPASNEPAGPFDRIIDARGGFAVPGLINMHQHLHSNLLKGLADGMLLEPWVFGLTTPSRKVMTREHMVVSTRLAGLEMLRTGTTCVLNHQALFEYPDYERDVVDALASSGMRHVLAVPFQCRTPRRPDYPLGAEEAAERTARLVDRLNGAHHGTTTLALVVECNAHHTELGKSSDELVRTGHALACARDMRIAVHVSGGTLSLKMGFTKYRRQTGRSDVEYLESLGVLDHRWILKHGIHFSDHDIELVASRGAHVVYTPTSESMRGGGLGPIVTLRRSGINCALGTDGPAVDYSVDMVEQMKACCYLQAVRYRDAHAIPPRVALEMATIGAARALGLEREIGSIETGKLADIVVFERSRPHLRIPSDPITALVRAARGADAHYVFIDGRLLLEEGCFVAAADCRTVIDAAKRSAQDIIHAAGLERLTGLRWPVRPTLK